MNTPITSRIQKSTQGGMKVQEPLLNVGGKSCGCPGSCSCGSPNKMYAESSNKLTAKGKEAIMESNANENFKKAIAASPVDYAPMKKKSCGYKK